MDQQLLESRKIPALRNFSEEYIYIILFPFSLYFSPFAFSPPDHDASRSFRSTSFLNVFPLSKTWDSALFLTMSSNSSELEATCYSSVLDFNSYLIITCLLPRVMWEVRLRSLQVINVQWVMCQMSRPWPLWLKLLSLSKGWESTHPLYLTSLHIILAYASCELISTTISVMIRVSPTIHWST